MDIVDGTVIVLVIAVVIISYKFFPESYISRCINYIKMINKN